MSDLSTSEQESSSKAETIAEPKDEMFSSFALVRGFVENFAKGLVIYTGSVYLIGFLITAARLARYSVASINLIDAQYIAAGIMPGLFLWITVLVVVSASHYHPQKEDNGYAPGWIWANVLFSVPVGAIVVLSWSLGERFAAIWSGLYPKGVPLILLLGELALWILIVGLRKRLLFGGIRPSKDTYEKIRLVLRLGYGVFLLSFALLLILLAPGSALDFYEELPQAYGGGKPLTVRLYVDRGKVPGELLDISADANQGALAWTIPLDLVFGTSEEYVVDPMGDDEQRAWVLKANAVYAVAGESD